MFWSWFPTHSGSVSLTTEALKGGFCFFLFTRWQQSCCRAELQYCRFYSASFFTTWSPHRWDVSADEADHTVCSSERIRPGKMPVAAILGRPIKRAMVTRCEVLASRCCLVPLQGLEGFFYWTRGLEGGQGWEYMHLLGTGLECELPLVCRPCLCSFHLAARWSPEFQLTLLPFGHLLWWKHLTSYILIKSNHFGILFFTRLTRFWLGQVTNCSPTTISKFSEFSKSWHWYKLNLLRRFCTQRNTSIQVKVTDIKRCLCAGVVKKVKYILYVTVDYVRHCRSVTHVTHLSHLCHYWKLGDLLRRNHHPVIRNAMWDF